MATSSRYPPHSQEGKGWSWVACCSDCFSWWILHMEQQGVHGKERRGHALSFPPCPWKGNHLSRLLYPGYHAGPRSRLHPRHLWRLNHKHSHLFERRRYHRCRHGDSSCAWEYADRATHRSPARSRRSAVGTRLAYPLHRRHHSSRYLR